MDGMNLRVLEYRVQRADIILFLDMPRYLCFWRIFKRTFQYYGTEAPASAPQCPERVNWAFFAFLKWVWNFKKKYPPKIKELLKKYEKTKTIFIFTSQKDVDEWMKKLENFL
ncbi:MAG TPA: AAA family ATPase, partial [Candidatus Bathyarchaeia archaeon]|nr:AAA family ATPase [Candidatus Bathyarchaeia archaeon]